MSTPVVPHLDPKDPMGIARAFMDTHPWRLLQLEEQWYLWTGARYRPIDVKHIEAEVFKWLEGIGTFTPTPAIASNVIRGLAAILKRPPGTEMPCWICPGDFPAPDRIIPFQNGLLVEQPDGCGEFRMLPHTPDWFSANCLPHDFDPDARCPEWEKFLDAVFEADQDPDDARDRQRALQQWFGYNLTGDIAQQKFAMLVGPPGSGKSTTLGVLGDMLGEENVATPTLATLWKFHGMETILGKMAALVGDAHLESHSKGTAILEKLKSVVGGDRQNIDRKRQRELSNVVVRARFTLAVNEMPQLPDTAGALERRLIVIPFNRSFRGSEVYDLKERFRAEMPGIVAWSIRGLADLRSAGRLHLPAAGASILDDFSKLMSPVQEFMEDCCILSPDLAIPTQTLWAAWRDWCRMHGHNAGNSSRFGAMLKASAPNIMRVRSGRDNGGRQIRHYQGIDLVRSSTRLALTVA